MLDSSVRGTLRAVSGALEMPVMVILILLMAATVILLGSLAAEAFIGRKKRGGIREKIGHEVRDSAAAQRENLAVSLARAERTRCEGIVKISDAITKLGPMFGLLGTLIPLGPGIIALGRGDTLTLSQSLLTAFDTTVAGLIAAAVAFVISAVRKRWYTRHTLLLETELEGIIDEKTAE